MDLLIYIIIVILTSMFCSFVFSMILLSAFFGIPQTIRLKKEQILLNTASIKPYLITIFIWITVFSIVLICLFNILREKFFIAVIVGIIVALLNSFKSLSKDNYKINMEELLKIQALNINPKFINFVNTGINNVLLKKANEIAQNRGFNNWNELETIFLKQNNIQFESDMDIEYRLNFIANYQGFKDFNELYMSCTSDDKNLNSNVDSSNREYDKDLEDMYSNDEDLK